jgi:hypothetical protein
MSQDKIFYNEYSGPENKTAASKDVSEHTTLEIEEKKYGLNKPQRIILSGKLKHGGDNQS